MKTVISFILLALLIQASYSEDETGTTAGDDKPEYLVADETEEVEVMPDQEEEPQGNIEDTENVKDEVTRSVRLGGPTIHLTKGKTIIITVPSTVYGRGGGGVKYTRWGKRSCRRGAQLVYDGYAAGGHYSHSGNGANYVCLPKNPQYLSATSITWPAYLYGTEYESNNRIFSGATQNYNVPCAVCYVSNRSTRLMVPARISCPRSWTREYYGYLMSGYHAHKRGGLFECVDRYPDRLYKSQANGDGALFYFTQAVCTNDGLPCSRYLKNRPTTCVVCTK